MTTIAMFKSSTRDWNFAWALLFVFYHVHSLAAVEEPQILWGKENDGICAGIEIRTFGISPLLVAWQKRELPLRNNEENTWKLYYTEWEQQFLVEMRDSLGRPLKRKGDSFSKPIASVKLNHKRSWFSSYPRPSQVGSALLRELFEINESGEYEVALEVRYFRRIARGEYQIVALPPVKVRVNLQAMSQGSRGAGSPRPDGKIAPK